MYIKRKQKKSYSVCVCFVFSEEAQIHEFIIKYLYSIFSLADFFRIHFLPAVSISYEEEVIKVAV